MRKILLLAASLLALSALARPAAAQNGAAPPRNPCADSLYQALRARPLDALSEREYAYFQQREKACTDFQRFSALANQTPQAQRASRRPLDTEATTRQAALGNAADVFVRNNSDRPIIVNSIRLYDCQNLMTICGMHYPKVRIAPNQQRRVFTIRYGSEGAPSSYRFEYSVSGAEEEQPRR